MQLFLYAVAVLLFAVNVSFSQDDQTKKTSKKKNDPVSFKRDVFSIIQKRCLPCHAEENFNPSELSMDDYDKLNAGGKNGMPWVAGKSDESLIVKKLKDNPPVGDRMPLNPKRKITEGKAKWLTSEEINTIATWIDEGAKNN